MSLLPLQKIKNIVLFMLIIYCAEILFLNKKYTGEHNAPLPVLIDLVIAKTLCLVVLLRLLIIIVILLTRPVIVISATIILTLVL